MFTHTGWNQSWHSLHAISSCIPSYGFRHTHHASAFVLKSSKICWYISGVNECRFHIPLMSSRGLHVEASDNNSVTVDAVASSETACYRGWGRRAPPADAPKNPRWMRGHRRVCCAVEIAGQLDFELFAGHGATEQQRHRILGKLMRSCCQSIEGWCFS